MKKRDLLFGIVLAVIGTMLAIGVQTFLKPCPHDAALKTALTVLGALIAAFALVSMVRPNIVTEGLCVLSGIAALLTPGTLVGICASEQMRCRMVTKPGAIVAGVLAVLIALSWLAVTLKNKKRSKE